MAQSYRDNMNASIATTAVDYFGVGFEYGGIGGNNKSGNGRTDDSRFDEDLDGDGLKGVDCSSLVWKALHEAGFKIDEVWSRNEFYTGVLFNADKTLTSKATANFDKVSLDELKPGDILMFPGHVAVFTGYSEKGDIQFFGSQTSTGPASVTADKSNYWHGRAFGAIRPKEELARDETIERFKAQNGQYTIQDIINGTKEFLNDGLNNIKSMLNPHEQNEQKATTNDKTEYVVKRGDTLTAIAREFGVSIEDITKLNPGLGARIDNIRVGEKFVIPSNENSNSNENSRLNESNSASASASLESFIQKELNVGKTELEGLQSSSLKELHKIMERLSDTNQQNEDTNNNFNSNK